MTNMRDRPEMNSFPRLKLYSKPEKRLLTSCQTSCFLPEFRNLRYSPSATGTCVSTAKAVYPL